MSGSYLEAESGITLEEAERTIESLDAGLSPQLKGLERNDALYESLLGSYSEHPPVILKSVVTQRRRLIPTPNYHRQNHQMGSGY